MDFLNQIITFYENYQTYIELALLFAAFWAVVRGILPVLYRLGVGLSRRKIAIFASGDNQVSVKTMLLDSRLFKLKNLIFIPSREDLDGIDNASIFLLIWSDWGESIDDVLERKAPKTPLIIYAKHQEMKPEDFIKLDDYYNVSVTNLRGRLLNDVVTAMITTSF